MIHVPSRTLPAGASVAALCVALTLWSCGDKASPAPKQGSKPATQASAPAASPGQASAPDSESGGASQTGGSSPSGAAAGSKDSAPEAKENGPRVRLSASGSRAVFVGAPPKAPLLSISEKAAEGCVHGAEGAVDASDPSLVLSADGGLGNVVLEITVSGAAAPEASAPIALDQVQCRFEPHVTIVPTGAEVVFENSDEISHNVNVSARVNDSMNAMIEAGGKRSVTYPKKDQIQIKCDIHPWMGSWIVVSDASFTALSDASGHFQLPPLPEGSHKIACWHESLGTGSGTLVVGAGGVIEDLEIPIGKRSSSGRR